MQAQVSLKESVIKVLDNLPEAEIAPVLEFALFIESKKQKAHQIVLKRGSFEEFEALSGIVSLGGDAVVDSENYFITGSWGAFRCWRRGVESY